MAINLETFTYVEDVVNLLIKASEARVCRARPYNAGNGNRYTLKRDVGPAAENRRGRSAGEVRQMPRAGDVRDSQADTTAAVRELGHAPEYSFEDGLRRTFQWYRADLQKKGTLQTHPIALHAAIGRRSRWPHLEASEPRATLEVEPVRCRLFKTNLNVNFLTTSVDYVFNWARKSLALAADVWAGMLRDRDDRVQLLRGSISRDSELKSSGPVPGSLT